MWEPSLGSSGWALAKLGSASGFSWLWAGATATLFPCLATHFFRVRKVQAQCSAMCSGTDELRCSPLTSPVHGAAGLKGMGCLGDTLTYTIALCMVLTLGSLAYLRHTFQPITHLFISSLETVLYPPQVIPCGIHGMGGGFHGMVDGFHSFGGWIPWNGWWIPYFSTWIPYFF